VSIVASNSITLAAADSSSKAPVRPPLGERIVAFIIRRRVALSILLFGTLLTEDVIAGVVPHDIFDWTNFKGMLGVACVLCGLAMRSWAAGFLIKDSELTTSGPYALIRNPLYLGSFLMIAGFCLVIDDRENIWIAPVMLLLIYLPKVRSEERGLASRFPEAWQRYSAATPRFVPRTLAWPQLTGWRLSQWRRSREYNAVLATMAGLVALKFLYELHQ
jgi:protein-S-isoprenylcysteine O-methyltransferase Ste14